MKKYYSKKKPFWIVLLGLFLLTGGQYSATSADIAASDLIINEFMAANGTGLTDEDGDYSDWIEIYNRSDSAVNLAGWALTNDPSQPQQWPFPDMSLGSDQYLVVFASGKDRTATGPGTFLHTNFKLNKSGEFLALHNILEGKFMDIISPGYPQQFRDVSYGRLGQELSLGYLDISTPGEPNDYSSVAIGSVAPVTFSVERGLFEAPFTVELATETSEATIRYTTDGSTPTETSGSVFTGPIAVETTTTVRAAAFRPDFLPSAVNTQTYLFLNDVLAQLNEGGAQRSDFEKGLKVFPAAAGINTSPVTIDNSGLAAALKSMPSISLVMDAGSLADLYAHPHERGRSSEQAVSFELFYPDQEQLGPQVEAGIRLYGDHSHLSPKQSYRLYFRSEYGSTRLEHPLFPNSSNTSFDTLVLQSAENSAGNRAFLGNEWLRSSQLEMSRLGAHGLFVNLYLNGQYVGLYNMVERPDADFMAGYLGGQKTDWFIANQTEVLNDELSVPADTLNYLFTTLTLASTINSDLVQPEFLAETYAAAAAYLDPNQLIDYVLLSWYAEIMDWPQSSWYAAIRPQDLPGRGKLLIGPELVTDDSRVEPGQPDGSQPDLHLAYFDTLMQNPDFKVKFADRLYRHLFNGGALSDAQARNRWQELSATIQPSIIAESALAASKNGNPGLSPDSWLAIHQQVGAGMEGNAGLLLTRARDAGYYPDFDPPQFNQPGGMVETGFTVELNAPVHACQDCVIYYTTDGSDPRLPITGSVIPTAEIYEDPIQLTTNTQVKARMWDGQNWSALAEAAFSVVEQDSKLRITEIMYNPAEGDDYEFVELKNTGTSELDLAGISLEEGIRFTFPPDSPQLPPGEFAVLVSNPATFAERFPRVKIWGAYEGHLSNKGEQIIVTDAGGRILLDFTYDDDNGWPLSADGRGDSLILLNALGDPNDPSNWRAGSILSGSPGAEN